MRLRARHVSAVADLDAADAAFELVREVRPGGGLVRLANLLPRGGAAMLERVQRALAGCQPGLQGLRHADIRRLARRVDGTWKVARVAREHAADGFDERLVVRVPRRATGRELHARWHVGSAGSAADLQRS